jgi:methyl-accepting chemotaxis protein
MIGGIAEEYLRISAATEEQTNNSKLTSKVIEDVNEITHQNPADQE